MNIVISNTLKVADVPPELYADLTGRLQMANPKWIENERMERWNRGVPKQLTFYRKCGANGLILPRGFMRQLLILARHYGVETPIEDRRRTLPPVEFVFAGSLKPYQANAVSVMRAKDFGTLCAPTGSGKTVMALKLVAERRQPCLIVVHSRELALQWLERIETFLGIAKSEIGWIGSGKMTVGSMISVALVQTLVKHAAEISPSVGHLIVDECHRAPSRTFTEAVKAFDARFMLGLSATPYRRDGLSKLIFWYLGDQRHTVTASELVTRGDILDVEVVFRPTDFKPYYDPVREYSKMLTELTSDDGRNRQIAADVYHETQTMQRPGVCLVLSDRKQHCATLQAMLRLKYQVEAELLTGDLSVEQRARVIEKITAGQTRAVIATGQLIGEGFDCSVLSTLFLATPVRFSGRVLQYLGRILRPSQGIERAKVYDYVDVHVGPLKAAAQARLRVYQLR